MSVMKRRLKQIDKMIKDFEGFARQYPEANFKNTVHMLQDRRAEIASKIGKKECSPSTRKT